MPFTQQVGGYQGGNFMFQGLSNLGQGIGKGIEQMQEAQQNEAADNLNGSRTQKNGVVAGLARNFAMDMQQQSMQAKQQEMQALVEQRQAAAEQRRQQTAAFNWTPDEAARQTARWTGNELVQTGPGKFQPVPYGDTGGAAGAVTATRLKDEKGRELPFVSVTKPGSNAFQILPDFTGGAIQLDENGVPYKVGPKGVKVPLTSQEASAMMQMGIKLPGQQTGDVPDAPSGASDVTKILNYIMGAFGGGGIGGPTRSATPTPTMTPEARGPQLAPQDQQALAWARANPGDPRAAAILRKLGITQ
jgi:hypothetical protein